MGVEKFHLDTLVGTCCYKCRHSGVVEVDVELNLYQNLIVGCSKCETPLIRFWATEELLCYEHIIPPGYTVSPMVI